MTLGSQMDDTINLFILHQFIECIKVADIHLHELIVWCILNILEISQITCIGQFIQIDDMIFWILVHEKAHHMTSNEACTTGNDNVLHTHYVICFYSLVC